MLNLTSGLVHRGVETVVDELGSRFVREKHDVVVFQGKKEKKPYRVIEVLTHGSVEPNVEGSLVKKMLHFFYADAYSRRVRRFTHACLSRIKQERPDVIIPLNGGWQTRWVRDLGRSMHALIVVSGQAGVGYDDWWNLQQDPDAFVALTPVAERWAKRIRPDILVERIPNGVDLDRFLPTGEKYRLKVKPPVILCVAALDPYKRIDRLLYAASELSNGSVVICGQGVKGEEERIDFLGSALLGPNRYQRILIDHAAMPSVYRAADILSLPSKPSEAFGISMVEAMACNLPVVVPDDENRRWVVGDAGTFAAVGEPKRYAAALEETLHTAYGERPRLQAQRFSWDAIADSYLKLFSRCRNERL